MHIILIGAQGSGKGTQAELLAQTFDLQQVASGDLFRKAFEEQTAIGLAARRYIDRGELVPDELVVALVLGRIGELDGTGGVLLDGFPRTVAQAEVLARALHDAGRRIDLAVYLDVPHAELLKRLSGRYICRASQHVYHATFRPPKVFSCLQDHSDAKLTDIRKRARASGQDLSESTISRYRKEFHASLAMQAASPDARSAVQVASSVDESESSSVDKRKVASE